MTATAKDTRDTAPEDRFCDLVMKGGITSGVVYPLAIFASPPSQPSPKGGRSHSGGPVRAGMLMSAPRPAKRP